MCSWVQWISFILVVTQGLCGCGSLIPGLQSDPRLLLTLGTETQNAPDGWPTPCVFACCRQCVWMCCKVLWMKVFYKSSPCSISLCDAATPGLCGITCSYMFNMSFSCGVLLNNWIISLMYNSIVVFLTGLISLCNCKSDIYCVMKWCFVLFLLSVCSFIFLEGLRLLCLSCSASVAHFVDKYT